MHTFEGLENGIEGCKKNIAVLEDAIERERSTIKEYRIMMDSIETADRNKQAALDNIHVEVSADGGAD